MITAVASGKGGTGKTTISACLAHEHEGDLAVVDLDVEEPNLHLFLSPDVDYVDSVSMEVPVLDEDRCTACGLCAELCQFKGLARMGEMVMAFPEMCHGCGGCFQVCPENALRTGGRKLGELSQGTILTRYGGQSFFMGRLRVGEAMSPPLMRAVKERVSRHLRLTQGDALLDCPPGVSCPAMTAVMDSDVILLAAESTPFGFHDFALAWEAFEPLGKPMAVVVNRTGLGDDSVVRFCEAKGVPVLAHIKDDRAVAEAYSKGMVPSEALPELAETFRTIMRRLRDMVER